ncbi:MAG: aminopeptidase N [Nitriliruptorales bacterium]|nr:aminopeptidase N [Nitriliruptorales bacterium]
MADNLTRDEAASRATLIRDVSYDVRLGLSTGGDTFRSETTVRFGAETGATTFIDLDAAAVIDATLNGRPLDHSAFSGHRLHLPGLAADNELLVVAECEYQHTGVGLHRFVDPVDDQVYLYTQFEAFEAHRVYACFDQPDLKAAFTLHVDARQGWTVVSNGAVIDRPADLGAGLWSFTTTSPISTYITAVVAGPYASLHDRHRDIDLGIYCRRSLLDHLDPEEIFTITKQGFDFFTSAFQYPYPFGKYDQLFVPEFNAGAMENAGCVTFSEVYIFRSKVTEASRRRRAETILHEMAHMWFGDLVTMQWWDDLWLNESFATYMAYRALVESTRFHGAWSDFASDLKAWAYSQDQLASTHPVVADIVDTDAVRNNFDGITYAKGASVLRQLAAWVGDGAFIAGLREYFPRHEFGNAELRHFLEALEGASERSLDAWAHEWLQTAGVATLRPVTEVTGDGCYGKSAVVQEAPSEHPALRSHRIGFGLYDLGDDGLILRRRIEQDIQGSHTPVPELDGQPVADLLLVNDGDLAYAKIRLDATSVGTLREHMGRLHDPLARALCWGSLWDMARDAELAARQYVAIVARHAHAETDIGVLGGLLSRIQAAVDRYSAPDNRVPLRTMLADRARESMENAEPGADSQLVWARAFASSAQTEEQLAIVRGILAGGIEVKGLSVDTDLRWHLLMCLAVMGAVDEDVIAAEERRDPTDQGRRRGATTRAALPFAANKAAAWDAVVSDDRMPLAMKRALSAGFSQYGQEELLRPYARRFLDVLPRIWDGRQAEESLLLTGALYPTTLLGDDTLQLADAALDVAGVPEPGKRIILEARDATRRALRARAADHDAAGQYGIVPR